ncbi:MAG TPA: hypothetical protein VMD02_04835 [Candidatus Omnitrophota bacterium]|nr:hypothetical protein [Candidatus Omnitrophota bacterium]
MAYLLFTGLLSLLFGILFLFSPEVISTVGNFCNKTVVVLDDFIAPVKMLVGLLLVAASAWMLWMVFPYGDLWYVHLVAYIIMFFGLLFVFFPGALKSVSDFANRVLLSTDDLVMGARKMIGILFIILSVYIFYSAFYIVQPSRTK